ncbi:MAG: nuclear transport factor 2 family protein [Ferruginibacter sp.]|nr:nuclear transport factor 2 family protein [Ferruginibacter sp.]
MNRFAALLYMLILLNSCTSYEQKGTETKQSAKAALILADKAFSAMSASKGMKNAFVEFIDSNGVLLRPNRLPITGANAIDFLIEQNDTAYTLTWEPHFAAAAASGDLGYTYGVYELHLLSKDTSIYGSYVSIWKKQQDGKWKFVLDTGNEGVGNE